MSNNLENLLIAAIGSVFVGTLGSALAILWTAVVHRSWPDRDTAFFLMKVFYGIGSLAMVSYLMFRYF
jgi:hypothetical protein